MNIETLTPEFEHFLQEKHAENYHGLDDDMPDAFEAWLERLTEDEWSELTKEFNVNY